MLGDKFNLTFRRLWQMQPFEFLRSVSTSIGELNKFFQDNQEQIDKIATSIGVGLSNAVIIW